jgi:hypothetical protein
MSAKGKRLDLKRRLAQVAGVWEGTYTHLNPRGELLDRHHSRQETRIEGDLWFERILYRWEDGREEKTDFRGRFTEEGLVLDDPDFHGETFLVRDDIVIFPYQWKSRPQTRIVETIVFPDDERRTRLWQVLEQGELVKVTVISERRLPGEVAEVWS